MIAYERLHQIASKMHLWIFLHSRNEQEVYDLLGLTDDENMELGYGGRFVVEARDPDRDTDGKEQK